MTKFSSTQKFTRRFLRVDELFLGTISVVVVSMVTNGLRSSSVVVVIVSSVRLLDIRVPLVFSLDKEDRGDAEIVVMALNCLVI